MIFHIDTESPFYIGATEAGFEFGKVNFTTDGIIHIARGSFKCVCGTIEMYAIRFVEEDVLHTPFGKYRQCVFRHEEVGVIYVDIALALYSIEAFSYRHLIDDGYSTNDAKRISEIVVSKVA